MSRYSLLLIGGAEANKVASDLSEGIPIVVTSDKVSVGGRTFAAKDAAVQAIYPNPLNPERYVFIAAGTSSNGMYFCDLMSDDLHVWDYVIDDGRIPPFRQNAAGTRCAWSPGCLTTIWHYDPAMATEGDAQIRAKGRQLLRPKTDLTVDPKVFDEYLGRYQIEKGPVLTLVRDGKRLMANGAGNPVEMVPLSKTDFRIEEFGVQLSLVRDASGKVTGFSCYQGGQDFMVTRLPDTK